MAGGRQNGDLPAGEVLGRCLPSTSSMIAPWAAALGDERIGSRRVERRRHKTWFVLARGLASLLAQGAAISKAGQFCLRAISVSFNFVFGGGDHFVLLKGWSVVDVEG